MAKDQFKLAVERRRRIDELLAERESVTTSEICALLGVSAVTARSDLAAMEHEGRLVRVRGGATIVNQATAIASPLDRQTVNLEAKRTIARLAVARVHDGDSILLDSGTTTLELLRVLGPKRDITIVTNDIGLVELADALLDDAQVILLGGLYRKGHRLTYGSFAMDALEKVCVDSAFMCPTGYLHGLGCMTEHGTSAPVKSMAKQHARHNYLLMDTSKIGKNSFLSFATLADYDEVFLERRPDDEFMREAGAAGTKVTFPEE